MNFVVRNSPSPGAMLSESNHESMLCYWEEAETLGDQQMKFQEFRKLVCDKHHTSPGNDRTVYPLLKNLGFLQYDAWMNANHFFTPNGRAYVKLLKGVRDIEQKEDAGEYERTKALEKLQAMMEKLVYRGVWIMLTEKPPKEVSYRLPSSGRFLSASRKNLIFFFPHCSFRIFMDSLFYGKTHFLSNFCLTI